MIFWVFFSNFRDFIQIIIEVFFQIPKFWNQCAKILSKEKLTGSKNYLYKHCKFWLKNVTYRESQLVSRSCKHCERDANTLKGAKFKKSLWKNWEFFLNLFQIFIQIVFEWHFL
jgi:hypothetical protein